MANWERICPDCGKVFMPYGGQQFCSRACRDRQKTERTKQRRRQKAIAEALDEGKEIHTLRCKQCGAVYQTAEKQDNFCTVACWKQHEKQRREERANLSKKKKPSLLDYYLERKAAGDPRSYGQIVAERYIQQQSARQRGAGDE